MATLPKLIPDLVQYLPKFHCYIPWNITIKIIQKSIWNDKRLRITKAVKYSWRYYNGCFSLCCRAMWWGQPVLVQTDQSVKQNREPRNKPTKLCPPNWQRRQKHSRSAGDGGALFNKWCWWYLASTCWEMKLNICHPRCTKINFTTFRWNHRESSSRPSSRHRNFPKRTSTVQEVTPSTNK